MGSAHPNAFLNTVYSLPQQPLPRSFSSPCPAPPGAAALPEALPPAASSARGCVCGGVCLLKSRARAGGQRAPRSGCGEAAVGPLGARRRRGGGSPGRRRRRDSLPAGLFCSAGALFRAAGRGGAARSRPGGPRGAPAGAGDRVGQR